MGVTLAKGNNVSLEKLDPGLSRALVGLGWDVRTTTGADFDLDASALLLGSNGKVVSDQHFIFYNNLTSPDGALRHLGDNLTGIGDGDDESIEIDLKDVSPDVTKIIVAVSIHDAQQRRQSFGMVKDCFIRVANLDSSNELARYDLAEDASTETAMVFGEIYRNGAEWKFRAVGQGYSDGLAGIARDFGVNI